MRIILAFQRCVCSMLMDTRPSPLSKTCTWYDTAMIDQRCISPRCLGHSFILTFSGHVRKHRIESYFYIIPPSSLCRGALLYQIGALLRPFTHWNGLLWPSKALQAKPFSPITCNEMSSRLFTGAIQSFYLYLLIAACINLLSLTHFRSCFQALHSLRGASFYMSSETCWLNRFGEEFFNPS